MTPSQNPVELRPIHRHALANFDTMPDTAEIGAVVVAALMSVSEKTVWKWAKEGRLPQPVRRGVTTRWKVAGIRKLLAGEGA